MTPSTTSGPDRAASRASTPRRGRDGPLTGVGALVWFMLRRDRVRLAAWSLGLGGFVLYLSTALPSVYTSEADLRAVVGLFGDPVGRLLVGPAYGFDAVTFERFVANGYGLYFLILVALMSLLLVTRHTRVEEQTGRADLVRANVVGRHAPLTAALVVAAIANLAVVVAVTGAMVAAGYGTGGSVLFAVGIGVTGLAFAGITALTVQLTEYSRAAAGMAGGVLGGAFVVRAGGDMAEVGGTALSWVAPLAWAQQTAPFVLDRWWPLLLPLGLAAVTAAIGYRISSRRDLGASLFAVRSGAREAPSWLRSPLTLALRLQRASILGWSAALLVAGLAYGSFTDAMVVAAEALPEAFRDLFSGEADMLGGYLGYMAVFMAYVVAIYAVLAVQHLRSEETSGRAEPVLATPVSRWRWLGGHLSVTTAGVVVVLVLAGFGTGVGAAIVTGDGAHVWEVTAACLNQVPAVLVVLGVAALLFGLVPRAVAASWVPVGYGLLVGTFGVLLDLPEWAYDLSPFEHAAQLPLESFTLTPVLTLGVIALGGAVLGLVGFRRRDIDAA